MAWKKYMYAHVCTWLLISLLKLEYHLSNNNNIVIIFNFN